MKIENIAASRPQTGVDHTDVVYEEVVECDITRLAGVFQSQMPAVVGPIRSVRKTDTILTQPLQGIFAYSGGAPYAIESIETAPVVRLDETTAGEAMFRMDSRGARAAQPLRSRAVALPARARRRGSAERVVPRTIQPAALAAYPAARDGRLRSRQTPLRGIGTRSCIPGSAVNGPPDMVLGGPQIAVPTSS